MVGSQIVLVNRTGEVLHFVADSMHYDLQPGENYGFIEPHGYFAMAQNPVMGSEDYYTQAFRSKVGVKGATDCTPLSDEELIQGMDSIERFNRKDAGLAPVDIVKPRHRMPHGRTGEVSNGAGSGAFASGNG